MNSVKLENLHGHILGALKDRHRALIFLSQPTHVISIHRHFPQSEINTAKCTLRTRSNNPN